MGALNWTMSLAILFTQGCSSAAQPPDPPSAPMKTVFDPLTSTLGRARAVQQTVDRNKENTQKAIDGQESGDSSQ